MITEIWKLSGGRRSLGIGATVLPGNASHADGKGAGMGVEKIGAVPNC
jgi:hypothetical protein